MKFTINIEQMFVIFLFIYWLPSLDILIDPINPGESQNRFLLVCGDIYSNIFLDFILRFYISYGIILTVKKYLIFDLEGLKWYRL